MKKIKNKKRQLLTFTNIIIISAIIVYILNVFVISPDTGSTALKSLEVLKNEGAELTEDNIMAFRLIGTWGGHVNDFLGFDITAALAGEIWRFFTVAITHTQIAHLITNMIALYIAGNHIEKKYGVFKTIALFIVLMIVHALVTSLIYFDILGYEKVMTYGASGWITCLIGMVLGKCLIDKDFSKKEISKFAKIVLIVYFVAFTFIVMPNVYTITAHVTGLVIGLVTELIIHKFIYKNKAA